jgi:hypothetical protein
MERRPPGSLILVRIPGARRPGALRPPVDGFGTNEENL